MSDPILFWTKWAAIGQLAGAAATFLAVVVSLYIAFRGRRPSLRLEVTTQFLFTDGEQSSLLLDFKVVNNGERPVYINGIGWRTGWLRFAPRAIRRQNAVQVTGAEFYGRPPPYELAPGASQRSTSELAHLVDFARERITEPFFSRDWPFLGRRATRIRAYVYTADGYRTLAKPEKRIRRSLVEAEQQAVHPSR